MTTSTLTPEQLHKVNAYWRAANYVSVGQIYLYDNPLLRRPLQLSDVKPLVVSHWGTTPGQNFIYVHLNRVINKYDLDMFYVAGPGHGGPAIVGNVYLEGTWSDVYPNVTQDEAGHYTAARELAAMSAVLEGLDTIVFTGGIGENDAQVRALICSRLAVIGVRLDPTRNRDGCDPISDGAARCQVRILPSQENEQIAHEAWSLY